MPAQKYERVVDNRMHGYGDIDFKKKIIRVNKKRSKKAGPGEVLDTIVHEETHRKHPKMHEKTVRKETKEAIKKMSPTQKSKQYSRYDKESRRKTSKPKYKVASQEYMDRVVESPAGESKTDFVTRLNRQGK